MQRNSPFDDERGVTPVIGIILLVAITVLLAATASALFLNFQDETDDSQPNTAFDIEYDASGSSDALVIKHASGDTIDADDLKIVISDASPNAANGQYRFDQDFPAFGAGSSVSAGKSLLVSNTLLPSVSGSDDLDFSGATVRIVWTADSGDSSSTLLTWSGD